MKFKKILKKINPWIIRGIIFGICFCLGMVMITYGFYKDDLLYVIIGGVIEVFGFVAGFFGLGTFTM